jgi:hypothetical protein
LLTLADLVANMTDMLAQPLVNWSLERLLKYLVWTNGVACGLRDGSLALETPALLA